jgi:hypothetical protein
MKLSASRRAHQRIRARPALIGIPLSYRLTAPLDRGTWWAEELLVDDLALCSWGFRRSSPANRNWHRPMGVQSTRYILHQNDRIGMIGRCRRRSHTVEPATWGALADRRGGPSAGWSSSARHTRCGHRSRSRSPHPACTRAAHLLGRFGAHDLRRPGRGYRALCVRLIAAARHAGEREQPGAPQGPSSTRAHRYPSTTSRLLRVGGRGGRGRR